MPSFDNKTISSLLPCLEFLKKVSVGLICNKTLYSDLSDYVAVKKNDFILTANKMQHYFMHAIKNTVKELKHGTIVY